jgi:hypothetical protein
MTITRVDTALLQFIGQVKKDRICCEVFFDNGDKTKLKFVDNWPAEILLISALQTDRYVKRAKGS